MMYAFDSPYGPVVYDWNGDVCGRVMLTEITEAERRDDPVSRWLAAYFSCRQVPLPPLAEAATPFQKKMRQALLDIPFGQVRSYGELAGVLKTSPRALGQALGANPLPIIVPCHRVVAANGLGGFSCGIEWKKRLLQFERMR